MNAAEQRIMALVLTERIELERRLRQHGTIVGIDGAAIRRFAQSIVRKRLHIARSRLGCCSGSNSPIARGDARG